MIRYVILHTGVGPFTRGQVVGEDNLGPDNVGRLLGLKAIREATPNEARADEVSLPAFDDVRDQPWELRLADKDREITDLKRRLAELSAEADALKKAVSPQKPEPPTPAMTELLAKSEQRAKSLEAQVAALTAQLKTAKPGK